MFMHKCSSYEVSTKPSCATRLRRINRALVVQRIGRKLAELAIEVRFLSSAHYLTDKRINAIFSNYYIDSDLASFCKWPKGSIYRIGYSIIYRQETGHLFFYD